MYLVTLHLPPFFPERKGSCWIRSPFEHLWIHQTCEFTVSIQIARLSFELEKIDRCYMYIYLFIYFS